MSGVVISARCRTRGKVRNYTSSIDADYLYQVIASSHTKPAAVSMSCMAPTSMDGAHAPSQVDIVIVGGGLGGLALAAGAYECTNQLCTGNTTLLLANGRTPAKEPLHPKALPSRPEHLLLNTTPWGRSPTRRGCGTTPRRKSRTCVSSQQPCQKHATASRHQHFPPLRNATKHAPLPAPTRAAQASATAASTPTCSRAQRCCAVRPAPWSAWGTMPSR